MSAIKPEAVEVQVLDLEYDVAAVGSVESSASEETQPALFILSYRLPENG